MDGGEKDKNSSAGMLSCYLFISRYFMQLGSCLHKSLCIRLHTVCPRNLYPFYIKILNTKHLQPRRDIRALKQLGQFQN